MRPLQDVLERSAWRGRRPGSHLSALLERCVRNNFWRPPCFRCMSSPDIRLTTVVCPYTHAGKRR